MSDLFHDVFHDLYGDAMALRKMWDAAFPPDSPPTVAAVAGYIGGGTPHVWTDQEWANSIRKSEARYKLPIFVRVPPTTRDPVAEANFCADWAEAHGQPKGTLIALDYETAISDWEVSFDEQIVKRAYKTILYGTRRTVLQNPKPSGGYWTATWNNIPHLDAGAAITQYGGDKTLGQPWDINLVADSVPLWPVQGDDMSAADVAAINKHADDLYRLLAKPTDGRANLTDLKAGIAAVTGEIDATQAAIANLQLAAVDPVALAAALGPLIGQDLADKVAAELSARLAQ